MAKTICSFCEQPAARFLGEVWLCAACAAKAQTEVAVVPGGFGVYVYIPLKSAARRMAYLERHDGDWTRAQFEAMERKAAAELRKAVSW